MQRVSSAIVTGGAGFVGSHIVDQLIERGVNTFVIDNLSTGSMENIAPHKGDTLFHFKLGDIRNNGKLLPDVEAEVLFHEAAIASVPKSVAEPILVNDVNLTATLEVLEYCRKRKINKFIFASSAAVYGQIKKPPATESMRCSPSSPYGASKMSVENYLSAYHNTYGLDTVILRYFNIFGPRQKVSSYSGVITTFINALLKKKSPIIFGDGRQTRDFVHVKDIALANLIAMNSSKVADQIFNVASGKAVSILKLYEIVRKLTGALGIEPKFGEPTPGDVRVGSASIEKIKRNLGYEPEVLLEEGLAELIRIAKRPRNGKEIEDE